MKITLLALVTLFSLQSFAAETIRLNPMLANYCDWDLGTLNDLSQYTDGVLVSKAFCGQGARSHTGEYFDHTLRGQITVNLDQSGVIPMKSMFLNYCSMAKGYLDTLASLSRGGLIFTGKCTTGGYGPDGRYYKGVLDGSFKYTAGAAQE